MILKRIRLFREARDRFQALIAQGKDPDEAAETVEAEFSERGLDPTTLMAIIALILQLLEALKK